MCCGNMEECNVVDEIVLKKIRFVINEMLLVIFLDSYE